MMPTGGFLIEIAGGINGKLFGLPGRQTRRQCKFCVHGDDAQMVVVLSGHVQGASCGPISGRLRRPASASCASSSAEWGGHSDVGRRLMPPAKWTPDADERGLIKRTIIQVGGSGFVFFLIVEREEAGRGGGRRGGRVGGGERERGRCFCANVLVCASLEPPQASLAGRRHSLTVGEAGERRQILILFLFKLFLSLVVSGYVIGFGDKTTNATKRLAIIIQ